MLSSPEANPSRFQRLTRFVKERPLFTTGVSLMSGILLHMMTYSIAANLEAEEILSKETFTGGPNIGSQVALRRTQVLGEIYSTKYRRETQVDILALGGGMTLILFEIGLNLARRGRNHFHHSLPTVMV